MKHGLKQRLSDVDEDNGYDDKDSYGDDYSHDNVDNDIESKMDIGNV